MNRREYFKHQVAGVSMASYQFPKKVVQTDDDWLVDVVGQGVQYQLRCRQIVDCTGGAMGRKSRKVKLKLKRDPKELRSLAYHAEHAPRLKEMRELMQQDLEAIGRPFGEFFPGGNAAEPGQIEIVKRLEIQGKKVTVPEALQENPGVADEPTPDEKAERKAEREARRKAREEANSNK